MKYQIGDKIIVLHTEEEGVVVDLINEKMVLIEVRGVQFPAYMDQIDFPYFKQFSQKKTVGSKPKIYVDNIKAEKTKPSIASEPGVFINFLPVFDKDIFDDDVVEKLKVYIDNRTNLGYNFTYSLVFANETHFELRNTLLPQSNFYVHDVAFENLNDAPRFDFEFTLLKEDKAKQPYFETSLKLKAKQLFKKIEEIKANNEPSFSFLLMQNYPDRVIEDDLPLPDTKNIKVYDLSQIREMLEPARTVIDIHIEKLSDKPDSLSNFEKLSLQLKTFEKYYDLAVANKLATFIVVHGIGSGKLRDEIHDILRHKKEVKSFVNQFHPSFGYGATEIYFNN
jgi:Smr domain